MKNYIILGLLLILLIGCSSKYVHQPNVFKKEYLPLSVPNWLLKIPEGEYEIGVSEKYYDKKIQYRQAKEFATVNYNRNKNSVIINNLAKKQGEEISNYKTFKLNVSASVTELDSIYNSFTIIDSAYLGNYFLGLFKIGKKTSLKRSIIKQLVIPDWFTNQKIVVDNNFVYATVKYSSANLTKALNGAMEKARFLLAQYKTQHITSTSITTYTNTKKFYTIETETTLGNLKTTNIFILKKINDSSLYSYEVYLKMRGKL